MEAIARPVARVGAREGVGIILAAAVLFGTMALFVRLAAREMPPIQVTFVRFIGSFLILMVTTRGQGLRARRGAVKPLIVRGLIGAAAIALYFIAIAGAGAGLATLIQNGYPVFAASFAALLLGRPSRSGSSRRSASTCRRRPSCSAPRPASIPRSRSARSPPAGRPVLAGGAVVAARHLRRTESASVITTWFMAVGVVVTAPALALGLPPPSVPLMPRARGGDRHLRRGPVAPPPWARVRLGGAWQPHGRHRASSPRRRSRRLVLGQRLGPHVFAGACCMIAAVALATDRG
jgi:drug/metabolite transporter (DMT)-like permease